MKTPAELQILMQQTNQQKNEMKHTWKQTSSVKKYQ